MDKVNGMKNAVQAASVPAEESESQVVPGLCHVTVLMGFRG